MPDFVSHACLQTFPVSLIVYNDLLNVNRSVAESCCSTGFSCLLPWPWAHQCFRFWFRFFLIRSVSAEGSLIVFLAFDLRVPFSDLEWIDVYFLVTLIPLALHSFWLWLAPFQQKLSRSCHSLDLSVSSFDFEQIIFCLFCLHVYWSV